MSGIAPAPAPASAWKARVALLIAAVLTAAVDLGTKAWAFAALDANIVQGYWVVPINAPPDAAPAPTPREPPLHRYRVVSRAPMVDEGDTRVTFIPGFWDFKCSVNTGAVFGIFSGRIAWVMFLTLLALGLIAGILWKADPRRVGMHVAFGFILGGALGNLWDRAWYAGVRDFIDWYVGEWHWPTFNVADAALLIGIGVIVLMELRQPNAAAAKPAAPAKA